MKTAYSLLVILLVAGIDVSAQRYARASGPWNTGIWALTPGGVAGSAATPTATDDVYTNGFLVTVGGGLVATCRNLNITYNLINSLSVGNLRTIIVTGTLNGWDDVNTFGEIPTAAVLSFGSGSTMIFTAANIQPAYDPYVIFFWDNTVPLGRVTFNLGSLSKNIIIPLSISTISRLQSGTLTADPGSNLIGNSTATFQVDTGATFNTNDPLTNFNNYQITGTLQTSGTVSAAGGAGSITVNSGGILNSTGTSGAISSTTTTISGTVNTSNSLTTSGTFQMNSTGVFNTSFIGVNQTEGWWSLTNRPSSSIIDVASTINYSGISQNVYTLSYGNLTLSGSGTKTSAGAGSINIAGNLSVGAGLTFNNSQSTIFNGTASQNISGGGTVNFNGGLEVNKSGGTLALSQSINVLNGLTLTTGTLDFGSNTVNLAGNLSNNATLTASAGTLNITGSTSISGPTTTLNNLTISGAGNLTAPPALNIAGNFTNNGIFNADSGTITFSGASAQSIAGTASLNNINCNSTAGLNVNGNINLAGTLTLNSSGVFDADGGGSGVFTVSSTGVNAGGRIAALPSPANFTGNVTVQRFVPGSASGDFRYLSSPVTSSSLTNWKNAIGVTGNFSDRSTSADFATIIDSGNMNASVFTYSGTAFTGLDGGSGPTSATSLSSRIGYVAYNYNTSATTLSYRGAIETGNVPVTISSTNSNFNLVPNPYPSPIDWDNVTITGLASSMWLRTSSGSFATYVQGAGSGTNPPFGGWAGEIATGQSFWTQSTGGNSTLTFTEAAKTLNTAQFVRVGQPENIVKLRLSSPNQSDELIVGFKDDATEQRDNLYDAPKRKNGNRKTDGSYSYINLSSYLSSADEDYAINTVKPLLTDKLVYLKLEDAPVGAYSINFSELSSMNLGYTLVFIDNFLNTQKTVVDNFKYDFSVTDAPTSTGSNRFVLKFITGRVTAIETDPLSDTDIQIYPNPTSGRILVKLSAKIEADLIGIVIRDQIGRTVNIKEQKEGDGIRLFDVSNSSDGMYVLEVRLNSESRSFKIIKK